MIHFVFILFGLSMAATTLQAEKAITVQGDIQMWKRECDALDRCRAPFAVSERFHIEALVVRPPSDSELSIYEDAFIHGGIKATLQTYRRLGNASQTGYVAHQVSLEIELASGEILPLSRCTTYQAVESIVFPVGACTAFHRQEDGLVQYGVTLWKD